MEEHQQERLRAILCTPQCHTEQRLIWSLGREKDTSRAPEPEDRHEPNTPIPSAIALTTRLLVQRLNHNPEDASPPSLALNFLGFYYKSPNLNILEMPEHKYAIVSI